MAERASVLVVDDEASIRMFVGQLLSGEGFSVVSTETVAGALAALAAASPDLVITDKNLPDGTGHDIAIRAAERGSAVIMMTGFGSVTSASEAMQQGVADYITKPINDLDEFVRRVKRVLRMRDIERANTRLLAELQQKNAVLEALAVRDPLTGLFNHAYFQESLDRELHRGGRNQHEVSLVFMDLDRFKEVNDTLGHQAGDKLLKLFAELLLGTSRRSDISFRLRTQDVAARYGGDEFALILPETPKRGAAVKAERLRNSVLNLPFKELGLPQITISLGVASSPADGADRISLIAASDAALYAAKSLGKNRLVTYSPEIGRTQANQAKMFADEAGRLEALDRLLAGSSFDFVYQPVMDVTAGRIIAQEALCRPRDALFTSPAELIAVAERAGRVIELGRALRRGAAKALSHLPPEISLLINLHPHELNDPSLLEAESDLKQGAKRVIFEITETSTIRNTAQVRGCIDRLREHGFRIALSDLSAGYSSLESLVAFEPEIVKLHASAVTGIAGNSRTARLLRHFVEYAAGEKVKVIVQDIENEAQRDAARALGFELMQGYLFGHPEPLA